MEKSNLNSCLAHGHFRLNRLHYEDHGSSENATFVTRDFNNYYRSILHTMFMLSMTINRTGHVCALVIITHNYMLMCNNTTVNMKHG